MLPLDYRYACRLQIRGLTIRNHTIKHITVSNFIWKMYVYECVCFWIHICASYRVCDTAMCLNSWSWRALLETRESVLQQRWLKRPSATANENKQRALHTHCSPHTSPQTLLKPNKAAMDSNGNADLWPGSPDSSLDLQSPKSHTQLISDQHQKTIVHQFLFKLKPY